MEPRGVWAASDSSARARSVMPPAARKQPLPDAEIDGAEVSWALPYRNAQAAYPRAAPAVGDFAQVILTSSRKRCVASKRATAKRLGGRGEGLSLLHDIGDENDALGVASLAARTGCFRRYVEAIAFLDHPGRLPLDGKLEAAFQDIGGFDPRMRVSGDGHARLNRRFHEQRRIARRRTVRLRQNLSRDPGRRRGWRALRRCFGRNELRKSADRARRKARESSSREHDILPACVRIISAVRTDADRKSFTIGLARRSRDARSPLSPGSAVVFARRRPHARDAKAARVRSAKSADDERRVLALAFAHAARLHPVVGAVEQCHVEK